MIGRGLGIVLLLIAVGITASCGFRTIDTGHVGVTTLFGRLTGEQLPEGLHLVNPLKRVAELSIRTQEIKEHADVPSSEGLIIGLDTSLLYRLDPARAGEVFQKIGPRYVDIVVTPNLRSVIRAVTAAHTANTALQRRPRAGGAADARPAHSRFSSARRLVENVLLRDIRLPDTLRAAIEAKQQSEQQAQQMQFVLQRERQEAERKRIEAQGVSDFQRIVSTGISDALLEWKGIEATEKLVNSPNSKIVVIGNPKNGLPLILPSQ